jgi:hypothetical protein
MVESVSPSFLPAMFAPPLFYRTACCSLLAMAWLAHAQQPSVPLNDTPPALTLPPLPAVPKAPAKPESKPETKPAPKPEAKPVEKPATTPPAPPKPATQAPPAAPPPPSGSVPAINSQSSTSTNGQFIVYGADLETRTWFMHECEGTADALKRLLKDTANWDTKVVVSLRTPPNIVLTGPAVVANISQLTSGGFHLQLTVQFRPDFNTNDLRSEIIRILLAERILRGHNDITTNRPRILPDWLLTGIMEGMRYRDRARPSATFAAVFKTGKVYGVEDIIGTSPGTLDAMTKAIYETSCCALVLALLDQPEGGLRMQKFLNALATDPRGDRELIDQWFPGIAKSKTSLEKWWSLQMAHLSRPSVFETLTPQETIKALEAALVFHFETEESTDSPAVATKADEPPPAKDEVRVGLLRRWFGGGDEDKTKDEKAKDEKPKTPEKKSEEPLSDQQMAQSKSVPLFTRWFGGDKKDETKSESKKTETKPAANSDEKRAEPKKEEPKKPSPAKPEPKKEEEKEKKAPSKPAEPKKDAATPNKPGLLQRLFSSDKKDTSKKDDAKKEAAPKAQPKSAPTDKDKEKDQAKDKDKKTTMLDARLIPHLVADLWLSSTVASLLDAANAFDGPRYTILGFGKKKDDKAKEEEEKAAKAKAEAKAARDAVTKLEAEKKAALKKAEELERQVKQAEEKAKETAGAAKKTEPKSEPAKPASEPDKKTPSKPKKVAVTLPLDEYAKVLKRKDAKTIIAGTALDLSSLTSRAHPLFQPLVADYLKWLTEIAAGHTKDADAQLKALKQRRAEVFAQARAVEDYVDFFETNGSTKWSGAFDDFLRVPQSVQEELPKRTDPLSKLLDEAEQEAKK